MASVETNVCMHITYTHIYFLTYFQTKKKKLFAITTTEMYLQAGLIPKEVGAQSWQEPEHDWLLAESSSLCAMSHMHCKAQECPWWSAAQQLEFQPQILVNFDATAKECICNVDAPCADMLIFWLSHLYYTLSQSKTLLYWLHITHYLHIKVKVCPDLGPNPLHTSAL